VSRVYAVRPMQANGGKRCAGAVQRVCLGARVADSSMRRRLRLHASSGQIFQPAQRRAYFARAVLQDSQRDQISQISQCARVPETFHERTTPVAQMNPVLGVRTGGRLAAMLEMALGHKSFGKM